LRLADLGLAGLGLARPRRPAGVAEVGPPPPEPADAGPRERGEFDPDALSEHEHVEPLVTGSERVRLGARPVDEAVAGADLVDVSVLPRQAGSAEHIEDLLLGAVHVRGRRPLARADLDPLQADGAAAGRAAEVAPGAAEMAEVRAEALGVVPVRDDGTVHGAVSRTCRLGRRVRRK